MRKLIALLVGAGLASLAFSASALAAPIVVDTTSDQFSGGGPPCTLREAVDNANTNTPAPTNGCAAGSGAATDTITFDPSVTAPAGPQTIDLGEAGGPGTTLLLNSNPPVTITGPGASELIIHAPPAPSRTIYAAGPTTNTATLSGLTVTGGILTGNGNDQGAGIRNDGTLTLTQVTVSGNQLLRTANLGNDVSAIGGGIVNTTGAILTLNGSTVQDNTASALNAQLDNFGAAAEGGGIFNFGTIHIHKSVIDNNHSIAQDNAGTSGSTFAFGGGISNTGPAFDIDRTQITRNDTTASAGTAGVAANAFGAGFTTNTGTGTIEETTIADNALATTVAGGTATQSGGGVFNVGANLDLISTTIARNGPSPAAVAANITNTGGTTDLKNTIVSDPLGAGATNCTAVASSTDGFNVDYSAAGPSCGLGAGELVTNPLLDPAGLVGNGGPTETIALTPASPAIDAGSNAGQTALFLNQDQRSFLRPVDFTGVTNAAGGNGTDIGAFEVQKACPEQTTPGGACPQPPATQPAVTPAAQPGATGQQAAALKKCKKKKSKAARKRCKKRAKLLPL